MGKKAKDDLALNEADNLKGKHGLFYTKKEPRKAMSTFLRIQNKFLVNSLVVSDRKAMIINPFEFIYCLWCNCLSRLY